MTEHVPYAVEAYPEGNQRHLSAESALFVRVITEGMFGFVPRGFRSFELHPSVPKALKRITLKNIRAFGNCFTVTVEHAGDGYHIRLETVDGRIRNFETAVGETIRIE